MMNGSTHSRTNSWREKNNNDPEQSRAQWSTQSFTAEDIVQQFTLPQIVKCNQQAILVKRDVPLPINLAQPLLLHDKRTIRKLLARNVVMNPATQRYSENDETVVIPADYDDRFSILTDDEVSVLFCFLCSDSSSPNFNDTELLDLLIGVKQEVYLNMNPVTSQEAQRTLNRLKSPDYGYLWEDQDKLTKDTRDKTMDRVSSMNTDIPFWYSNSGTASAYLRSKGYNRKSGERCVIGVGCDSLLIHRLQMNILTHVTMEDTNIYPEICQILNVSNQMLKKGEAKRKDFLMDLRKKGKDVKFRRSLRDSVDHVTWLWRYGLYARPDIVRSCIGLYPHNDIYIIDNKAYRKLGWAQPTKWSFIPVR
ncbi:uncharacterized protein LOC134231175 [Saccostrea cucullata]|uniref:uncharacterized protein LOC134231175 n=1 Tax=Saccostrea cuccullata TaxID=36930 RepID=UPI002ED487C7